MGFASAPSIPPLALCAVRVLTAASVGGLPISSRTPSRELSGPNRTFGPPPARKRAHGFCAPSQSDGRRTHRQRQQQPAKGLRRGRRLGWLTRDVRLEAKQSTHARKCRPAKGSLPCRTLCSCDPAKATLTKCHHQRRDSWPGQTTCAYEITTRGGRRRSDQQRLPDAARKEPSNSLMRSRFPLISRKPTRSLTPHFPSIERSSQDIVAE